MRWYAMYSHSGKELDQLCEKLGRSPNMVLTDNPLNENKQIGNRKTIYLPRVELYRVLEDYIDATTLVTLHGFMGIVPYCLIEQAYSILNLHPARIDVYPTLRGKDPQKRFFEGDEYCLAGCVIHRVTSKVDMGTILHTSSMDTKGMCRSNYIDMFRADAVELWAKALGGVV